MKLCIVGGAGYIGSRLIPSLLEHNYEITVFDLFWFGDYLPDEIEKVKKDVLDIKESELADYDQVIFLAGLSNDPMAEFSPKDNYISNASAPSYLAYIAKKVGVKKFIFADSCSVYGYTQNELYDESSSVTCQYPYGVSKLQGETGVLQLMDENFSVICLRQGTVSGYSPRMRFDLLVNTMFMAAMTKNKIVVNNPTIWRPLLAIEDAVTCYLRSIQADMSINGIFNVASGNYTIGTVADQVLDYFSGKLGKKIDVDIKNVTDFRNYKISAEKSKNILGINYRGNIETILKELSSNFDEKFNFNNNRHFNIKVFKKVVKE